MNTVNREYLQGQGGGDGKSPLLYPSVVAERTGAPAPDTLTLTVMSARLIRQGTLAELEFREYPGYILWVGGRGLGRELLNLADQIGDDPARWPFARVTLEKVSRLNPRTGGRVEKFAVAPVDPNTEAAAARGGVVEQSGPQGTPAPRRLRKRRSGGGA